MNLEEDELLLAELNDLFSNVSPQKPPSAPSEPTNSAPKEPTGSAPKVPTDSAPKEPTDSAPKEPTDSAPKEPTAEQGPLQTEPSVISQLVSV